jgi:hypothetical protein
MADDQIACCESEMINHQIANCRIINRQVASCPSQVIKSSIRQAIERPFTKSPIINEQIAELLNHESPNRQLPITNLQMSNCPDLPISDHE